MVVQIAAIFLACDADPDDSAALAGPDSDGLRDGYLLDGDDSFPESVTWDPQTAAFYTSSLGRGDVTKLLASGDSSTFFVDGGATPWVTIGLEVDVERRRLWVCASVFDGSVAGQLWLLDLDSEARLATFDLGPARADASCTDVNVAPDGVAYVTDRANPDIYRVDPADGTVEIWLEDAALEPGLIGQNGIALTPDGQHFLVTKYLPVELLRVPLANPADVSAVALSGEAFEGAGGLAGADDIVFSGDTLYATLVDRLFALNAADASWTAATVQRLELSDSGVTGLVVAGGAVYGSNGQAVEFSLSTPPQTPFWVRRLVAE